LLVPCLTYVGREGTTDALDYESSLFGLLASTEDMKDGMSAFMEKRKADFKGR